MPTVNRRNRDGRLEGGELPAPTLSLGDRACPALARRLSRRVWTADAAWLRLVPDLDVEVVASGLPGEPGRVGQEVHLVDVWHARAEDQLVGSDLSERVDPRPHLVG